MNRKPHTLLAFISVVTLFASTVCAQPTPKLTGPYLGQTPPGDTAVPFAVSFLGADLHSGPVFSVDGQEVFWSPLEGSTGHILTSRLTDSGWSTPREIKFPTGPPNSGEPCLSPDGTRLFFLSQESAATNYKENIWVATRENDGWGAPQLVSPLINAFAIHWQISVADNGNLYFHARPMGGGDIYVSAFVDGTYQEPVALGSAINSDHGEGSPFIAPDESYLIFSRSDRSSSRKGELFISFRTSDGTWTEAKSMDRLNRDGVNELCPTVSRDGKYLFFLRNTRDGFTPHWVSASVIDERSG
jgi:Tol biopolymer transport system component